MAKRKSAKQTIFTYVANQKYNEGSKAPFRPTQPAMPLSSQPGSAQRIDELRRRLENGEQLWHPEDVTVIPTPVERVFSGNHREFQY